MSGIPTLNDLDEILAGLDEEQHAAVTAQGRVVVVMAGAGSGKARVLTRRIAYRAASGTADGEDAGSDIHPQGSGRADRAPLVTRY